MPRSLVILFFLVVTAAGAQTSLDTISWHPTPPDTPATAVAGAVTVRTPARIESLLKEYGEQKHPQQGYRVQIFLGDRTTAETTKRAFLLKNPDVPAYLSWLAPNFRLRVGDLRTRLEAEHLLFELKATYPGSYIVPDEIEMPRLDP